MTPRCISPTGLGKDFGYNLGLANGDYILEFQFAETFFASAGQRRFDVHAEGQEIISNLDVFAAAGGKDKAYSVFEAVTVTDGILNVRLETTGTDDLNNALLNGLVVHTTGGPPPPPPSPAVGPAVMAINTGGGVYTDTDTDPDTAYAADTATASHTSLVGPPRPKPRASQPAAPMTLCSFQSYRTGKDFGYNLGLANGDYILEFQFAETFFASAGQRRFDVHAEGQEIISNLDVFAAAGGKDKAYSVFEAVTVTDGILNVRLETTGTDDLNNALLNGLVVHTTGGPPPPPPPPAVGPAVMAINTGGGVYTDTDTDPDMAFTLLTQRPLPMPLWWVPPRPKPRASQPAAPTFSAVSVLPNGQGLRLQFGARHRRLHP